MKKMQNLVLIILLFFIILTGCSNESANKTKEYKKSLTFSNLVDESSQEEVRKEMEQAEIPTESIESMF